MIVIRLGSTGSGVALARRRLSAHGFNTHQTGAWNSSDMRETMLFQHKHGLTADGIVGPVTWVALLRPAPHPAPVPPIVKPHPPAKWHPQPGLDCAWAHPDYHLVAAAGFKFVGRYVSNDPSKDLTLAEAHAIHAAGMRIVLIAESTAERAKDGHEAGKLDAKRWSAQAAAVGMPAAAPLLFAADYDVQDGREIAGYYDGVNEVIGVRRTGAYGGLRVIKYLFDSKRITYGMQTYGWSHGVWDQRAQIHQTQNGVPAAGASGKWADLDLALVENYGGW